ncbi:DUF3313 domain-containing protein [Elioraea rosea]|uniref:DUF3313 domain-containing protein n=1 Tax=Elioraea rosea TaxID=2492390 RepID=UPI001183C5E0|nr:DUF3313 domain-containing protein [Elioraea rosea]
MRGALSGSLSRFGAMALLLSVAACGPTQQASHRAAPSGFLGPEIRALMQPGTRPDQAQQFYVRPGADIRRYTSIVVEPVQVWHEPGRPEDLAPDQLQFAADLFYAAMREELAKDFRLVSTHGPETLVLASAITQVSEGGPPALATVSSFVPLTRLLRRGASVMTGSDPLTGAATGEIKVTDAETGELLGAAIDSREARTRAAVTTSRWDDVQSIARYWAELVRFRLCRGQQRENCVAPA